MDFSENKTDSSNMCNPKILPFFHSLRVGRVVSGVQKFFHSSAFLKVFTSAILLLAVKKKKKPDEMEDIY